jgi:hypothetical protein
MQGGQILLLTDKEYEQYKRHTQDAKTYNSSLVESSSGLSLTTPKFCDEQSQDLIADEHKNSFNRIVKNLGFVEISQQSKLVPVTNKHAKTLNKQEFDKFLRKLSESVPKTEYLITHSKPDKPVSKRGSKRKNMLDSAKAEEAIRLTDEVIMFGKPAETFPINQTLSTHQFKTFSHREGTINPLSYTEDNSPIKATTPRNPISEFPAGKPARLSKEVLSKYYSEAVNAIPDRLISDHTTASSDNYISPLSSPSTTKIIRKKLKRKSIRRPTTQEMLKSKSDTSIKGTALGSKLLERESEQRNLVEKREQKKLEEQKLIRKAIKELRNQYKIQQQEGSKDTLGELLCIMFHKNPADIENSSKDSQKVKALHAKLYKLLAEDPSEVYRIVNMPEYSKNVLIEKMQKVDGEWTEEHELAFKSLLRKTHSFNSIAKTRMFKEIEKTLPKNKTVRNMEWKYDRHSPWLNDLDYHDSNYFDIDEPKNLKKATISNLARSLPKESKMSADDILKEEIETLRKKTGETTSKNILGIKKAADKIERLKTFQEGLAGFEMLNEWEKSPERLEGAKVKLADHIIGQSFMEMKNLNKVRYSYLSSKIAYQRAKMEHETKVLQKAETNRQAMRKRQEEHLRLTNIYRAYCKKKYGDIKLNLRRSLINTSHAMGSPLFKHYMIKLGYLPKEIEPKPKRLKYFDIESRQIFRFDLPSKSLHNLSAWSLPKTYRAQRKVYKDQIQAIGKIQGSIRGFLQRTRMKKWKKSVRMILHRYRVFRLKKLIIKCIILEQIRNPRNLLSSLLYRIEHTHTFNIVIKTIAREGNYDLQVLSNQLFKKTSESISIELSKSPSFRDNAKEVSFSQVPIYARKSSQYSDYIPVSSKYLNKKAKRITFSALPQQYHSNSTSANNSPPLSSPTRLESILRKETQVLDDLRDKLNVVNGRLDKPMLESLALKINHLRKQILTTRLEMWKLYIGSVTGKLPTDEELLNLLSRDSIYIQTCKQNMFRSNSWHETYVDIPATKDAKVIEIKAQDLVDQPVDHVIYIQIINCLLQELQKAIESNREVKIKYQRHKDLQNKLAELDMSSSTLDLFAKKTVLLASIPEEVPEDIVRSIVKNS